MNFKRSLIVGMFALSQLAVVIPVSANQDNSNDAGVNTTVIENQLQPQADANQTTNTESTKVKQEADSNYVSDNTQSGGYNELVLIMNSKKIFFNGSLSLSGHPLEVKKGVSFVSIRGISKVTGMKLTNDPSTKEIVLTRGNDELRFKAGSAKVKVNGVASTMKGAAYSANNNFMVPLTAITKHLKIPFGVDNNKKTITLKIATSPVASFVIGNKEVFAGQTYVQYLPQSYSPKGLAIVNEEWDNRQEIFNTPGYYTVSYRVQDASGEWSNTYSMTIHVVKPHTPPVANFKTNKDTYKMGEPVTYTDLSTDEENAIVETQWENKELAFFTPGDVVVRLKVINKYGLFSTVEKKIKISDEQMYTRDEFNKLFLPIGDKFAINGKQMLEWQKLNYTYTSQPVTLIRSNSPEVVYSEGILYHESAIGDTRFLVHHVNMTKKNMKIYLVATNKNDESAHIVQTGLGFAGPNYYAGLTGKQSLQRYFDSLRYGNQYKDIYLSAGQSKIIMPELSARELKNEDVISLIGDLTSDRLIHYTFVMVSKDRDPIKAIPNLKVLAQDVHKRGTFNEGTRDLQYNELVGKTPVRLMLGDNSSDPYLVGYDAPTGQYEMNAGNFGVIYHIRLPRVAPNTLITFNPRGGYYSGIMMINGETVSIPSMDGINGNENSILHRTGDREQNIEFTFTAAPGSNLPVGILFQPLPPKK
jgi:PKD repeat protein